VGQQQQPVGFGDYLRNAIHAAGFATPTQFARAVNTDPSVVLRWLSGDQRPTIRSLERVAPKLGKSINEMVGAAYPDRVGDAAPATGERLHSLGYEVGRMLASDSPISAEDREALTAVLNRMLEPYRRDMRRRNRAVTPSKPAAETEPLARPA
jgi:transcriptional regulator with XRE-family HTH domain